MNPRTHAVRLGLGRGWAELLHSLRSSQDQWFYVFTGFLALGYLFVRRNSPVPGTDVTFPSMTLPSVLAALIIFGMVVGPAYSIAMEKEDGTLLRARAAPHGLTGYFTGQVVFHSLGAVPQLVVILVPSFLLFDRVMADPAGWLTLAWVVVLGLLASLPLGMIVGALVPNSQRVGTWGMLPVIILMGISGIFFPMQQLWVWVQAIAQVFPMYWLGLGMRSAFLPDSAATLELTGTWRTWHTAAVLLAWALLGALITPRVLRRMSRRQTGSQVQSAREATLQWVR